MTITIGRIGIFTTACEDLSYALAQDLASEVEELGYGAVWVPETVGDALVTATALLAATSKIAVATGITSIWARDPTAMAGAQRRLTHAFPDRFVLGLGVSHGFMVEGIRRQRFDKPLTRMSSYLDEMDAARYTAALMDRVADDGFAALAGAVESELPPRPPRVLAALGPRMLALSAEKADGALLYFQTPEHTQLTREAVGPAAFLAPTQMVVLEEDPDSARTAARRILSLYSFLPSFIDHFARLGFAVEELSDGGSNRLVDAVFARGDVDAVAKRIEEHLDAGADHVAVQVITPTWPRDAPIRQWRDLAVALVG